MPEILGGNGKCGKMGEKNQQPTDALSNQRKMHTHILSGEDLKYGGKISYSEKSFWLQQYRHI